MTREELRAELQRQDTLARDAAERLRVSLERRAALILELEASPGYVEIPRLTPIVVELVRFSRWRHFNIPAVVVGPFVDIDEANAWGERFKEGGDEAGPDGVHADQWLGLHPPTPAPRPTPQGHEFHHVWRRTRRVIFECPCGEQKSRALKEGPPNVAGCPGLHNQETDRFEQIAAGDWSSD